ncbi:MAG: hypothetical protein U0132_04165 [Gemmatimonadaceae bacterium]
MQRNDHSPRHRVAGVLEVTADRLSGRADAMNGRFSRLADNAAGAIDSAAKYLRTSDATDMATDLRKLARRHPGKAVIMAIALGYAMGRKRPTRRRA